MPKGRADYFDNGTYDAPAHSIIIKAENECDALDEARAKTTYSRAEVISLNPNPKNDS
jgi:hypothetical protein